MPLNKEKVIQVVEQASEIGVAGIAEHLKLDKGTVRKVALEAVREGRIGARNDGDGYVFFSIGGGRSTPEASGGRREVSSLQKCDQIPHSEPNQRRPEPQVIEGTFREIVHEPRSRSLVPVEQIEQAYDSRLAGALQQHALARRGANPGRGQ